MKTLSPNPSTKKKKKNPYFLPDSDVVYISLLTFVCDLSISSLTHCTVKQIRRSVSSCSAVWLHNSWGKEIGTEAGVE
jgi:hypothetical protein